MTTAARSSFDGRTQPASRTTLAAASAAAAAALVAAAMARSRSATSSPHPPPLSWFVASGDVSAGKCSTDTISAAAPSFSSASASASASASLSHCTQEETSKGDVSGAVNYRPR
ncbi:hypothetical protein C4D60_Mb10t08380 [Musa balbisiana]|uniref:Uncharacterized protein n=1 Tax=Musa balbisiana TaxID=52838 RepID=A0A4S8IY30_MUSBA|nr:hypothetical protein C4D60_Mb10t08380 [Musa balbisiana]